MLGNIKRLLHYTILGRLLSKIKNSIRNSKIINGERKMIPYYLDEESLIWMNVRDDFFFRHKKNAFLEGVLKTGKKISLGSSFDKNVDRLAVLQDGQTVYDLECTKKILNSSDYSGKYRFLNIPELEKKGLSEDEYVTLLFNPDIFPDLLNQLVKTGVWGRVMVPRTGFLHGTIGKQYFDVFEAHESEIVVDAGAFDGRTESDILEWGGEKINHIFAFEPDKNNAERCRNYYEEKNINNVTLIEKGLSDRQTTCQTSGFSGSSGSSLVEDNESDGDIEVSSLDREIGNEKVTFIKMDIEGFELSALKGAQNIIKKNKPRLAICVYHKVEDLAVIPQYILSLDSRYRFYLRHYTTNNWETVLYAEVK